MPKHLVFLAFVAAACAQDRPTPNWSWDTLQLAFHGANHTGMFTEAALQELSRFSMVTIEKWYTKCGAKGPKQAGPECDVEDKMYTSFKRLKEINSNITTIMYLNSNFDFAFYKLHGKMMEMEARGEKAFLRDRHGTLASLCNDGNVYCNITTFDHTVKAVQDLWTATLINATKFGGVDGVFADHAYNNPSQDGATYPTMCNGGGSKRVCYEFDQEFTQRFVDGHNWLLNNTQQLLAKSTGGPIICGPQRVKGGPIICDGVWNQPTEFKSLRAAAQRGLNGTGPFIIEANKGEWALRESSASDPSDSKLIIPPLATLVALILPPNYKALAILPRASRSSRAFSVQLRSTRTSRASRLGHLRFTMFTPSRWASQRDQRGRRVLVS
jgi:hypothetical protein